ncbi:hypothetical protein M422DRAFT_265415 [Sphaerobolus stellatus SS14]|uniref:Uncharacterized protein n=1 Tax=Sphaerobolus stellatus (strain SS14) TaxID=990650 RepID=A0A0C9V5V7_SPHS4|nr:hypothetical protein M422DRAFT_265415 [Sphaerobolus stellatus SS14]
MHYRDGVTDIVLNSVSQDVSVMAETQHPTQASSGDSEEVSPTVVKDGFKPREEVHNVSFLAIAVINRFTKKLPIECAENP